MYIFELFRKFVKKNRDEMVGRKESSIFGLVIVNHNLLRRFAALSVVSKQFQDTDLKIRKRCVFYTVQ